MGVGRGDVTPAFTYESLAVRVVFGPGARRGAAAELDRLDLAHVLVVATASCRQAADAVVADLDHRVTWRIDGVRRHVPEASVDGACDAVATAEADGIVTIGGGSATGLGKAVALRTGLPLVALPTTYAGSEMTPVYGVTTATGKHVGRDLRVLPRAVMYDPELTLTLPPAVTAASGMNAMAHCVEALWAPGASPLTSPVALDATRALAETLPGLMAEPHDLRARTRALAAACQAGMSFAVAGSGLHHRLCHAVAGRYDLPHAETHAVVLPHVVAFNEPALGGTAARVAVAVGAGRASTGLHTLAARLGLPAGLAELGMPESAVDEVVAEVAASPPPNPRPADEEALRAIVRAAWAGDPPG